MSVEIKFFTIAERKPKHNEDVIYFRLGSSFDAEYFEPIQLTAEYCWFESDK